MLKECILSHLSLFSRALTLIWLHLLFDVHCLLVFAFVDYGCSGNYFSIMTPFIRVLTPFRFRLTATYGWFVQIFFIWIENISSISTKYIELFSFSTTAIFSKLKSIVLEVFHNRFFKVKIALGCLLTAFRLSTKMNEFSLKQRTPSSISAIQINLKCLFHYLIFLFINGNLKSSNLK